MRWLTVIKDEFKRTSWVILVAAVCMLICNIVLVQNVEEVYRSVMMNQFYAPDINIMYLYLPVSLMLALCQSRGKSDDMWNSMPYKASSLYGLRLAYGMGFIALLGIIQLCVSAAIINKYSFVMDDIAYLGYSVKGIYNYKAYCIANLGTYTIAAAYFILIRHQGAASAALFFTALMPEMLIAPIARVTDILFAFQEAVKAYNRLGIESLQRGLNTACELKYAVMFGINAYDIKASVYGIGCFVYAALAALMLVLGFYVNKKRCDRGNDKIFYNKAVKTIYILLLVLFVYNIIETLFLQGGL